MDHIHSLALFCCVTFGILFSTISSQSTLCIGFCNIATQTNTCPSNYQCLNLTTSPIDSGCCPIPPERCIDHNVNCPTWASNGFCLNGFWTAANKLSCRKSCGLCTPTSNSTCFDKNTTSITFNSRNNSLCEVWARNGFCGSKTFYGAYVRQTCNASCGCTNITEPLSFCQQLAGKGAAIGPCVGTCTGAVGTCIVTDPTQTGDCCNIAKTATGITCDSILAKNISPCGIGGTFTCPNGASCICDTSDVCNCCQTRNATALVCGTNIGSIGPTTACAAAAPFCPTGQQCIGGQCCVV
uniref:ShKT domain-containing protein n=1 Tax=Acrobeloides nanus TaxID=290746 RepID=A0A914EJ89_9BILA